MFSVTGISFILCNFYYDSNTKVCLMVVVYQKVFFLLHECDAFCMLQCVG